LGAIVFILIVNKHLNRIVLNTCMVQINPTIKEQLKILGQQKMGVVNKSSALVVNLPIGQLKPKDTSRALYVMIRAYTDIAYRMNFIIDMLKNTTVDIKKLVDDSPNLTKEEVINQIKLITLEPEKKDKVS
jgi:ABC-type uncharacterized transport system permease subunit